MDLQQSPSRARLPAHGASFTDCSPRAQFMWLQSSFLVDLCLRWSSEGWIDCRCSAYLQLLSYLIDVRALRADGGMAGDPGLHCDTLGRRSGTSRRRARPYLQQLSEAVRLPTCSGKLDAGAASRGISVSELSLTLIGESHHRLGRRRVGRARPRWRAFDSGWSSQGGPTAVGSYGVCAAAPSQPQSMHAIQHRKHTRLSNGREPVFPRGACRRKWIPLPHHAASLPEGIEPGGAGATSETNDL
ncbi:hypothetical protein GQ53DRAFT_751652 [Thozetella sp. PMI_491]|nr:hypothetical protein GQ53DRAFT_751652 [Thozetella sp. PMI_491]